MDIHLPNRSVRYGDKINDAYALGGPRLALATVKRVLGITINQPPAHGP